MITTYFRRKIAESVFKHQEQSVMPPYYYIALSTTLPDENGEGIIEPGEDTGYQRAKVDNDELYFDVAGEDNKVSNHSFIYFLESVKPWIGIVAYAIFDEPTGGNLLMYGSLSQSLDVPIKTMFTIPIGGLKISIENNTEELEMMFATVIKNRATGNPVVLNDSLDRRITFAEIRGTTTQSPIRHLTAPVITADKVTGGQTAPTKCESANRLPYPYEGKIKESNGVKYTVNNDGTVTVKGKATGYSDFYLKSNLVLEKNTEYVFSGLSKTTQEANIVLFVNFYDSDGQSTGGLQTLYNQSQLVFDTSDYPKTTKCEIGMKRNNNTDIDEVVKPMLNKGTSPKPFTPYISDFSKSKVSVMGKNIFDIKTLKGVGKRPNDIVSSWGSVDGDMLTVVFPLSSDSAYWIFDESLIKRGMKYTLSADCKSSNQNTLQFGLSKFERIPVEANKVYHMVQTGIVDNYRGVRTQLEQEGTLEVTNMMISFVDDGVYEPYKPPQTYTPQADGTVLGVQTIDGNMTVLTDTEGVDVDMIIPEPIRNAEVLEVRDTGANLFDIDNREIIANLPSKPSNLREFNGNRVFVGLAYNNYFDTYSVLDYNINKTSISIKSRYGYGLGFDCKVPKSKKLYINIDCDYSKLGVYVSQYTEEGEWIGYASKSNAEEYRYPITFYDNAYWFVIIFVSYDDNTYFYTNPHASIEPIKSYEPFKGFIQSLSQRYSLSKWDRIFKDDEGWKIEKGSVTDTINSSRPIDMNYYPSVVFGGFEKGVLRGEIFCNFTDRINFASSASIAIEVSAKTFGWSNDRAEIRSYLDNLKSSGQEITVQYEAETPTITPLPEADAAILDRLQTYYPNTTIQIGDRTELEIEYLADTKEYIDNQIAKNQALILDTRIK